MGLDIPEGTPVRLVPLPDGSSREEAWAAGRWESLVTVPRVGRCHLFDDRAHPSMAKGELERVRSILGSFHFDIDLMRCTRCGQLFIEIFWEICNWEAGEDDVYRFDVPVSPEEAEAFERKYLDTQRKISPSPSSGRVIPIGPAEELVASREHLVRCNGEPHYWKEEREIAFLFGPG